MGRVTLTRIVSPIDRRNDAAANEETPTQGDEDVFERADFVGIVGRVNKKKPGIVEWVGAYNSSGLPLGRSPGLSRIPNEFQCVRAAVSNAFFEVALDPAHLIGDVCEA